MPMCVYILLIICSLFIDTIMAEAEDVLGRYLGGLTARQDAASPAHSGTRSVNVAASQRLQLSQSRDASLSQDDVPGHNSSAAASSLCGGIDTKIDFVIHGRLSICS